MIMPSVLKQANELFKSGEYEKAELLYNSLLSFDNVISESARQNLDIIKARISRTTLNEREKIFAGIASIPQRTQALKKTIASLLPQVDRIGVFLDKYSEVPNFLLNNQKIEFKLSSDFHKDIGDAGKFYWVDDFEGYYFTCDDDLVYPPNYVERILSAIENYKEPVVVGWHGSVILTPFTNYYDSNSRRVFSFGAPRSNDTPVHVLGTGCLGFNTRHIKVKFNDFKTPNMADVYFALLGQDQNVPFIVIKHDKGEIYEIEESQDFSIYQHSSKNVDKSRHNTKERQNEIVSSINWTINYVKSKLNILVLGRFKINEKGGIFKSSNLLNDALQSLGHSVDVVCLSELGSTNLKKERYDFSIVYAPDPERPDFGDCLSFIKEIANKGTVCAVNFSFNLVQSRTDWIASQLQNLNSNYPNPRIFFASFSNSTSLTFPESIRKYIVPFAKTIDIDRYENACYHDREGIFLGDLAKLSNEKLVFGKVSKWLEQIRIHLPHVNIYALKHYHTNEMPTNYIKVIPYSKDIGAVLRKFRIAICLTPGATFEMIPLESMLCGTPVVFRNMPQSHSEYLAPIGVEVHTPEELGVICKNIYEREQLWTGLSKAGYASKEFFDIENVSSALDLSIRKCLLRSGI